MTPKQELRMTRLINLIGISSLMLLLAACGGSDTPATSDVGTYSLAKIHSTAVGNAYLADITGSDSVGIAYTSGIYKINNLNQIEFTGVMATPRYEIVDLEANTDAYFKSTAFLIDGSGYILATEFKENWCEPTVPVRMPESVSIGDAATLPQFDCGSALIELNWSVEDAGEGNIQFIVSRSEIDADGVGIVLGTTTAMYTLDAGGNVLEFSGTFITFEGYTVYYSTDPDTVPAVAVEPG